MDILSQFQAETEAPGLIDRTIENLVIHQALCEVGIRGWLELTCSERVKVFIDQSSSITRWNDTIFHALSKKFRIESITVFLEYAIRSNPCPELQ